uniref:Uncharacterized protein n=1 Tax=Sphaerodactylus townsendi TaxID=933632 RepID=A0ACB8EZY8_9SAUR
MKLTAATQSWKTGIGMKILQKYRFDPLLRNPFTRPTEATWPRCTVILAQHGDSSAPKRTSNWPPFRLRATECVVTASADAAARDSTSVGSRDLETIDTRPLQVSTPSPTSQVSTSEISNYPEDDATQIPMSQMSALFADTSGDVNDVLDHPIAGCSGANEGSTPMPMMELTSPERRMTAERRRVRRVGVLADFAKAMVEQGEVEAMERRRFEDRREREVASFMQSQRQSKTASCHR